MPKGPESDAMPCASQFFSRQKRVWIDADYILSINENLALKQPQDAQVAERGILLNGMQERDSTFTARNTFDVLVSYSQYLALLAVRSSQ